MFRHTDQDPASPLTGTDRYALVQRPFMVRAGGTRQADHADVLAAPTPTRMPSDNYGLVPRGAVDVNDVRFRMIEPHENQRVMNLHQRVIPQADGTVQVIPFTLAGSSKRNNTKLAVQRHHARHRGQDRRPDHARRRRLTGPAGQSPPPRAQRRPGQSGGGAGRFLHPRPHEGRPTVADTNTADAFRTRHCSVTIGEIADCGRF